MSLTTSNSLGSNPLSFKIVSKVVSFDLTTAVTFPVLEALLYSARGFQPLGSNYYQAPHYEALLVYFLLISLIHLSLRRPVGLSITTNYISTVIKVAIEIPAIIQPYISCLVGLVAKSFCISSSLL